MCIFLLINHNSAFKKIELSCSPPKDTFLCQQGSFSFGDGMAAVEVYLDGASGQECAVPCYGMLDNNIEFLFVDRILLALCSPG